MNKIKKLARLSKKFPDRAVSFPCCRKRSTIQKPVTEDGLLYPFYERLRFFLFSDTMYAADGAPFPNPALRNTPHRPS